MGMLILESAFWMAGFAVLAIFGRWLVKRGPVPNDGDAAPHVPAACVVTTERTYRFPPVASRSVAWGRVIGHILVVIGVGASVLLALAIFFAALCGEC
jgi:hypothetical protein